MFLSDDRVKGSVSLEDQSMTKFPDGKPSTTTTPSFLIRSAAECDDEAKSAGSHEISGHIQVIPMSNMGSMRKCLEKLDIADCDRVTDNGVCLLQHFCCLEELNLANCGLKITDNGGLAIANIRTLKRLNLSWLISISDVTLIEVAKNCQSLVELVITGCGKITGDGICAFAEHKFLETLVMASCFNVSIFDIKLLVFGCRSLNCIGLDRILNTTMTLGLQKSISTFCRLNWM
ncbi:hypothetical protein Ancab_002125 [Ancistrocladus abbreviatus]